MLPAGNSVREDAREAGLFRQEVMRSLSSEKFVKVFTINSHSRDHLASLTLRKRDSLALRSQHGECTASALLQHDSIAHPLL